MTDSCPTGITFGDTVTLSPSGEKVLSPHTAYFNNGDYVVIWTEKTLSGPRLEFQLFSGTNNQKLPSTPTEGVAVYPAIQTDPWLRIGTTAVGVYEDYTFLIAWSTLEKTRDPWYINVNTYKYDVINSKYTTLDNIAPIESSKENHGKFGFATLSLDNAFALAYKKDRYTINVPIYKKENDYDIPSNPITETVTASYLMELIVNAVPTQYFFSVVWSPLMNDRGITVQNYKIEDQTRVSNRLQITANPRDLKADLSYGGTSTVAWHEASDICDKQNYLKYKAQMLSDTALLDDSFEISVRADNEDLDTYLQSVITQSATRVVATFLKKEETSNEYIVRIFDNNGNKIQSNSEPLTSTTPAPVPSGANREALAQMMNTCTTDIVRDIVLTKDIGTALSIISINPNTKTCMTHADSGYKFCSDTASGPDEDVVNSLNAIFALYQQYLGQVFQQLSSSSPENLQETIFRKYRYIFGEMGIIDSVLIERIINALGQNNDNTKTGVNYWPNGCTQNTIYMYILDPGPNEPFDIWFCPRIEAVSDNGPVPSLPGYYDNKLAYLAKAYYVMTQDFSSFVTVPNTVPICNKFFYNFMKSGNNELPPDQGLSCLSNALSAALASNICDHNLCSFNIDDKNTASTLLNDLATVLNIAKKFLDGDYHSHPKIDTLKALYTKYIGPGPATVAATETLIQIMQQHLTNKQTTVTFYPLNHFYVFAAPDKIDSFVEGIYGMNTFISTSKDMALSKQHYVFLNFNYRTFADYPQTSDPTALSKFHALTHELSHSAGTTDTFLSELIYGDQNCQTRASTAPHVTLFGNTDSNIVADCFSFFIDNIYLIHGDFI